MVDLANIVIIMFVVFWEGVGDGGEEGEEGRDEEDFSGRR